LVAAGTNSFACNLSSASFSSIAKPSVNALTKNLLAQ